MKARKSNRADSLLYIVIFLLAIFALINIFVINSRFAKIAEARIQYEEKIRPAVLEITKIIPDDCNDCYDINLMVDSLKKQNVNITDEIILTRSEADSLISSYNLEKLPAVVVTGEVNKAEQLKKFFEENGQFIDNSTATITNTKAPYYLINENKVVGMVSIINLVDSSCSKCTSLIQLTNGLIQAGVVIADERTVEYNSTEGVKLIAENEIKAIPAIIISDQVDYYPQIKQSLSEADILKRNNAYAIHSINPPYRNLTTNEIAGLVDLVVIKDESCDICYNVDQNKVIVQRLGATINNNNSYDISSDEAQEFIAKYNITKVPIILLSPEASVYPSLLQAWKSVGSVEDDGWFVMRNPEVLGAYKDLTTNAVKAGENG